MTKEEIYNHLAQVYLGKRSTSEYNNKKKRSFNKKIFGRILGAAVLLVAVLGLMAFLSARHHAAGNNVIFALTNSPLRIPYDLTEPYPQIKSFSVALPRMDAVKYTNLHFSIRGTEEGHPGIVKVIIKNRKNENAAQYVENIGRKWQKVAIPLADFEEITDWGNVTDVSFVLEAWNAEKKKGIVLIDDLSFAE